MRVDGSGLSLIMRRSRVQIPSSGRLPQGKCLGVAQLVRAPKYPLLSLIRVTDGGGTAINP